MSKQIYTPEDTDKLRATIGARAKLSRRALKLTQAKAARRIGISAEFYARVERGHALPSVPTLKSMADTFNVSVDYLIGMSDTTPPMKLASYNDRRQVMRIVNRARHDPDLIRVLVSFIKLCEGRV